MVLQVWKFHRRIPAFFKMCLRSRAKDIINAFGGNELERASAVSSKDKIKDFLETRGNPQVGCNKRLCASVLARFQADASTTHPKGVSDAMRFEVRLSDMVQGYVSSKSVGISPLHKRGTLKQTGRDSLHEICLLLEVDMLLKRISKQSRTSIINNSTTIG